MFFYLEYRNTDNREVSVSLLSAGESLPDRPETAHLYVQTGKQRLITLDVAGGRFLLLGDPVTAPGHSLAGRIVPAAGKIDQEVLYEEIKGHYYWFYLPTEARLPRLFCGNSFGAIYPVYHAADATGVTVCSSSFLLAEKTGADERDKQNLLERLLFNYPFFNSGWWKGVRLLEAHRYLQIGPIGSTIGGNFEVSNYFAAPVDNGRDSLPELAELFQKETELFFPGEEFGISLTGGFDGRTLVAAAKKAGMHFFTYSFGHPDSSDVSMPARQAAHLRIPYFPIYLDEPYVANHSLQSAHDFMRLTEYNGNFGRPHYHYAAGKLAEKTGHILTGNFGSELFRALHLPGVMMSDCLIRVFSSTDDSWKDFLRQKAEAWDPHFFREETDALIAGIEQYLRKMEGWEANHKFYYFVFNEIFRKYFGPELVMQSAYLNNRTPYLNLHFFKALNRSIWSGVHARLFEKVKSKRMKGQKFYATFIRQADPALYHLKTNKGYSPADVLENWRLPLLAGRVIWHKYLNNREIDDNSVHAFIQRFHRQIAETIHTESPAFFRTALERSFEEINEDRHVERLVKFYSIAAGWAEAGKNVVPVEVRN